ncbi:MAG: hypothetical protein DMD43_10340 [Gemmatimonadetes bacterium]|nr:MAG: hypothetical protein DMD43_10340 [Gemmatimonadota bacterium]
MAVAVLLVAAAARPAAAQGRAAVEAERTEYTTWLATAPLSPRRAVTVRPVGPGLTLGPSTADVPLEGVQSARLEERGGRITLRIGGHDVPIRRGRPSELGRWRLLVSGPAGRATLAVFRNSTGPGEAPLWYAYDPKLAFTVSLLPEPSPSIQRILAPDGVEVEATGAGAVAFELGGASRTLRVMRLPGATEDESDLEVYFRDATADHGTYPAGRFVSLIPLAGGRYLLDFNRARNPFCAYNTVYPCPAPWRGNTLPVPVPAGERYHGSAPPPRRPPGD